MKSLVTLAAVCALAAALGGTAAATSTGVPGGKTGARVVQIFETMAGIVSANAGNCTAMGNKLSAYTTTNARLIHTLKLAGAKYTTAERTAYAAYYLSRLTAATNKMQAGITKCGSNPKITNAFRAVKK